MSHYLYAIMDGKIEAPLASIQDLKPVTGPLAADKIGRHWLIHGEHDGSKVLQTRRFMLAHARILETLMTRGPLLPMRFGLIADRLKDLNCMAAAQADAIDAQLDRIAGRVEMGVRVEFDRDSALAALFDADQDLMAIRDTALSRGNVGYTARVEIGRRIAEALDRRRGDAQKSLLAGLRPMLCDHVLRSPESDVEVLRAECLLRRASLGAFEQLLESKCAGLTFVPDTRPRIRLIGPTPPYNFVSLNLLPEAA